MKHHQVPIIYNLFPRLAGQAVHWLSHARRALELGCNWLFINPIAQPGGSRSLYATQDYYRVNRDFVSDAMDAKGRELRCLTPVFRDMSALGVWPLADLVINHTSVDCPLIQEHPSWFRWDDHGKIRHPYAVDPDDPFKKTVWGDLAEVDNRSSPNRDALWHYWERLIEAYLGIGVKGFRCDAAYQVPVELWKSLIAHAKSLIPDVLFWAENLGCTVEQTRALRDAGFDLFCNSSKWWNFRDAWCLDQHREFQDLPSVSFAETHDTARLSSETGGNEAIQRQRYAFAAIFSAGLMLPIGFEFGFQKKLDVVTTSSADWEEPVFDIRAFIRNVHEAKLRYPLLQGEGAIRRIETSTPEILILSRQSHCAPHEQWWIVVNTVVDHARRVAFKSSFLTNARLEFLRLTSIDREPYFQPCPHEMMMGPAEVLCVRASGTCHA